MNRRGFFKGFVGAVAGAALAEELSTKSIFLPPKGGWATKNPYGGKIHENIVQFWDNRAGGTATPEQILDDIARLTDDAVKNLGRFVNAGVPLFLTNYIDPQMLGRLLKPTGRLLK